MSNPFDALAAAGNTVQLATFGAAVTYTRLSDAVSSTPTGIVSSGEQFEDSRNGSKASIFFRLSDFSTYPAKGDTVTFNSKVYAVAEDPRDSEDGLGGIVLQLRYVRVAP